MALADSQSMPGDLSLSHLRRMHRREQAAAVCYRVGLRGVEFLLVRTRSGRWTFPKGSIVRGLSHAQSAALEAVEEAGVHGRIEIAAFASYVRRRDSQPEGKSILVLAYLCEVRRLAKPHERKRERTWFAAEKAKRRLQEGRAPECGAEFAAVVDRAVARVTRMHGTTHAEKLSGFKRNDPLRHVSFEVAEVTSGMNPRIRMTRGSFARYLQRQVATSAAIEFVAGARVERFLPEAAPKPSRPILRLGSGNKAPANPAPKLTAIDGSDRSKEGVSRRNAPLAVRQS